MHKYKRTRVSDSLVVLALQNPMQELLDPEMGLQAPPTLLLLLFFFLFLLLGTLRLRPFTSQLLTSQVARKCSGKGVGLVIERLRVQLRPRHYRATTLGKLFTPNVPLFTKKYNLVPCEGLHAKAPYCGSGIGPNEQGEYCTIVERF